MDTHTFELPIDIKKTVQVRCSSPAFAEGTCTCYMQLVFGIENTHDFRCFAMNITVQAQSVPRLNQVRDDVLIGDLPFSTDGVMPHYNAQRGT